MGRQFAIQEVFRLSDGITVIACKGEAGAENWSGRQARIVSGDLTLQELRIQNERSISRKSEHLDQFAIDTLDRVKLSAEEVNSGMWSISIE